MVSKTLKHIAFIMDGNGRWAQQQNKPRSFGHKQGAKQIGEVIDACIEHGIQYMSFFSFSLENWKRPQAEINLLMKLLSENINKKNTEWFMSRGICVSVVGFEKNIPLLLKKQIKEMTQLTKNNKKYFVDIYFNYGGQQEIINACNLAVKQQKKQTISSFEKLLLSQHPDVDLLIRTSGEQRISNFLLWQSAYAEIIFEPTFWPAYDKHKVNSNVLEYQNRIRRFGGL